MSEGRTVILVPRREGFPDRDALWRWCRAWWERAFPTYPVVEGHHTVGLFNRSAALNTAARMAGAWDTAIIIDSDVICEPESVRQGLVMASKTERMVLPYTVRKDLDQRGTRLVMNGHTGNWNKFVRHVYEDVVSSVVLVNRRLWDAVGGFDEAFQGWGWEDNAFRSACATFGAGDYVRLPGEVWHLYHRTAKDNVRGSPSWNANMARAERYRASTGDPHSMRAIQRETVTVEHGHGIPKILHRVVPEQTTPLAEEYWSAVQALHPDWRFHTHRDPLVPSEYPLTSGTWSKVKAGAQLADLVRLEVLYTMGGVYVDQDYEPYLPFDSLCGVEAFAGWEDPRSVPNAVLGARPGHPAIKRCLDTALQRVRAGKPIWDAGPGVLTDILPGRRDVLLLPPGSFYPYHYKEKGRANDDHHKEQPWSFGAHHWWGSWLPKEGD